MTWSLLGLVDVTAPKTYAYVAMNGIRFKCLGDSNTKVFADAMRVKDKLQEYILPKVMANTMEGSEKSFWLDGEIILTSCIFFEDGSVFDYELKKHICSGG